MLLAFTRLEQTRGQKGAGLAAMGIVEKQCLVFEQLEELCASLSDAQWKTETECPGWSVQDNLSHIIGTEWSLLGRPNPDHEPGEKPWVRNPIGANNETHVDYRRDWPPDKVLAEFRDITAERKTALRAMTPEDLKADSWTPIGPGTVADLLAVRIMDCWVHEQDIRRAVDMPGNLDGPVAQHAFGRHASALGFVVGKKAAAPKGTTVVFEVTGAAGGIVPIGVQERAEQLDEAPSDPTVKLTMDFETFNVLCTGRRDPEAALDAGKVAIDGDEALGRTIVQQMNFMI